MRSLSYVTKGVPTCFADCIDYVKSHVLWDFQVLCPVIYENAFFCFQA